MSMQAFQPLYYRTCGNYVAGPEGHAGRDRDAKPGTSHQGEVTANLHIVINLRSLTQGLAGQDRKLRHFYVYVKYGDVQKNLSQGTHDVCQKSSRPSPSVFPPTHLLSARAIVHYLAPHTKKIYAYRRGSQSI